MTETMELLPCPFCGETPTLVEAVFDSHDDYVYCHNCEVTGPAAIDGVMASFKTPAEAIAAWNRRPTPVQRELSEGEVEAAAKAILKAALGVEDAWGSAPEVSRNNYRNYARAALRAARSLREQVEPEPVDMAHCVVFGYVNWRGEFGVRKVVPSRVWFGATEWHPEPCWLLTGFDLDKQAERDFAINSIRDASPPEAIAKGCTCPVIANHHGRGVPTKDGRLFWYAAACPVHGRPRSPTDASESHHD